MGLLDNSGDIILDAVLTDTGRFRLAKGDGTFKIAKFAFADDEIDYSKYNKDHVSGSAYYDLDILQTPVFEAFTNNASSMKHRLLSIPRTNLLYLPTILLNETEGVATAMNQEASQAKGMFAVAVDSLTEEQLKSTLTKAGDTAAHPGVIYGATSNPSRFIQVDQGLNTEEISHTFTLDPDLKETRYIVQIDNRLGSIANTNGSILTPSFIDDDNIATYNFSFGAGSNMIGNATKDKVMSPINGPRGTNFKFTIRASLELNSSDFLFTKLGSKDTTWRNAKGGNSQKFRIIDTTVRIVGATTGTSLDLPVRFIKKQV